jgi:hypothetical protein
MITIFNFFKWKGAFTKGVAVASRTEATHLHYVSMFDKTSKALAVPYNQSFVMHLRSPIAANQSKLSVGKFFNIKVK